LGSKQLNGCCRNDTLLGLAAAACWPLSLVMLLFGKPGTFWLMSPFPVTSDAAAASCCRFLLCGAGEVMLSSRQQQSLLTAVAQRYAVAEPVSRLVDVSYLSNASLRELCVQAVQEGLDSPTNSCSAIFALQCCGQCSCHLCSGCQTICAPLVSSLLLMSRGCQTVLANSAQ
jgi:hypothetical protein